MTSKRFTPRPFGSSDTLWYVEAPGLRAIGPLSEFEANVVAAALSASAHLQARLDRRSSTGHATCSINITLEAEKMAGGHPDVRAEGQVVAQEAAPRVDDQAGHRAFIEAEYERAGPPSVRLQDQVKDGVIPASPNGTIGKPLTNAIPLQCSFCLEMRDPSDSCALIEKGQIGGTAMPDGCIVADMQLALKGE